MTIPKLNISWTLIEGDKRGGFSIFWADDGLDTGPILLQRDCYVGENDTVDSIYNGFMYPEGIKVSARSEYGFSPISMLNVNRFQLQLQAMKEAVDLVADGRAPAMPQSEVGATYDPMMNKDSLTKLDVALPAMKMHNFIR